MVKKKLLSYIILLKLFLYLECSVLRSVLYREHKSGLEIRDIVNITHSRCTT